MVAIDKQAIAGVTPAESGEAIVREVWPSISATGLGRLLGQAYRTAVIGRLVVLLSIPVALALYLRPARLLRRYTLTSRRVLVRQGLPPKERQSVELEQVAEVRVEQKPGQEFFRAADLHLMGVSGTLMTLPGVVVPEAFRHHILGARDAFVKVREIQRRQKSAVA